MTPPAEACPSCGHALPPGVQFCPECGAIVTRDPAGTRVDRLDRPFEVPPSLEPPPPASAPASSRAALVAGAATLLVAVALAFLFWPSSKPSTIPVPGEPAAQPTAEAVAATPSPQPTVRPGAPAAGAAKAPPAPPPAEPARRAEQEQRSPAAGPETAAGDARRADGGREAGSDARPPNAPAAESERHASRERPRAEAGEPRWFRMRFRAPLFAEPSETATVVAQLPEGTRIRVTRQVGGFLAVESTTGKAPGYVSRDDAIPESTAGAR